MTALSILRLVASPPGRIVGGAIRFQGKISAAEVDKPDHDIPMVTGGKCAPFSSHFVDVVTIREIVDIDNLITIACSAFLGLNVLRRT